MSEHNDTISDFCNISSSKRIFAREYQSEGIPFWRGKEIVEKFHGKLEVSTELFIPVGRYEEIKVQSGVPKVGDILLTSVGTIGVPYLVSDTKPFYFKDGNITWLQTNDTVCAAYLYYWLISPIGKRELSKCTIGVAQPAYTIVRLKQMSVAFPDLPTQERIAAILSAYDDLIENNRRRIALLEQAARLLYREWFVHFRFPGHETSKFVDGLPEGWVQKPLGDVCTTNKSSYKKGKLPNRVNYIDIGAVSTGHIDGYTSYDAEDAPGRARRIVEPMDTIWSNVRPNLKAYSLVMSPEENDVFSTGFTVLHAETVSPYFLYFSVTTDDFVKHLINHATGVSYPAVRADDFERAEILIPTEELMDDFHSFCEPLFQQQQRLSEENEKLTKARDLLLPRLMDGRIPVKV